MPLTKKDAPANAGSADDAGKEPTKAEARAAINDAIDASAGVPEGMMRDAAEALPEKDAVQKATKAAMLAEDAQTEAKEKAKVVDESPNAAETPSGSALKKVAGISDDVKRGEQYAIHKAAARHGMVPAEDK